MYGAIKAISEFRLQYGAKNDSFVEMKFTGKFGFQNWCYAEPRVWIKGGQIQVSKVHEFRLEYKWSFFGASGSEVEKIRLSVSYLFRIFGVIGHVD